MTSATDQWIANMQGEAALPRDNGELVFEAPWEGRAFGVAVALKEQGLCEWGDFRDRLVAEIASTRDETMEASFYEQWLSALVGLAVARDFITPEELERRTAEYASGDRSDDVR